VKLSPGQVFEIQPREFVIISTLEKVTLKHGSVAATLYPRSSVMRRGLIVEGGVIDAFYSGHLTIPVFNSTSHAIKMYPGERMCQLMFHQLSSVLSEEEASKHGLGNAKYMDATPYGLEAKSDTKNEVDSIKSGDISGLKNEFPIEPPAKTPTATATQQPITIKEARPVEKYPYLPEGRTILYAAESHPHMAAAKEMARQSKGCKQNVGVVIVKDDQVVARGANCIEIAKQSMYCPRGVLGCKSGEGYEYCNTCLGSHGEYAAIVDAQQNNVDTRGADVYLYGHWWACEPCWNVMIEAGIKDFYLLDTADEQFKKVEWSKPQWSQTVRTYVSGALTNAPDETRRMYELVGVALDMANLNPFIPHLYSDPNNPEELKNASPAEVYIHDKNMVTSSQVMIAFLDQPSFGVGQEIQIAQENNIPIIGVAHVDAKISRMPLGVSQMQTCIGYTDVADLLQKLNQALYDVVVPRFGN